MPRKKPESPFHGRWRIDSMSAWDEEYLHEEVEAFFEFGDHETGGFQFGYVQGELNYRIGQRNGKSAVEFSWDGGDAADGTPLTGRGWAVLEGN